MIRVIKPPQRAAGKIISQENTPTHAANAPTHRTHHGTTCDVSGQSSPLGARYRVVGQNHDVNEALSTALAVSDQASGNRGVSDQASGAQLDLSRAPHVC